MRPVGGPPVDGGRPSETQVAGPMNVQVPMRWSDAMPPVRCPECRMPLSDTESSGGACPLCGGSLAGVLPPPVEEKPAPAYLPAEPPAYRRLVWIAAAVLVVAGAAVGFHYLGTMATIPVMGFNDQPATPPDAKPQGPDAEPARTPGTALAVAPPTGTPPVAPPAAPKSADPPVAGEVLKIDKPGDEYRIESIRGGKVVRLSGRAQTLRVGPIDGGSTLDASALEVKRIVFTKPINGRSTVTVRSPDGVVEFRGEVSGQSRVTVEAPGGRVTFTTWSDTARDGVGVGGESQVTITAREVTIGGPIAGTDTRVLVTLTRGGSLTFKQIDGQARLQYRKSAPGDPEPGINAGRITPPAQFKKVD